MVDTASDNSDNSRRGAIAASAQYLFKRSVAKFKINLSGIWKVMTKRHMLLGLAMYLASLVFYLYALHAAPVVSFVYPIFSSSLIFVLLISKYVLKERMSVRRIAGMTHDNRGHSRDIVHAVRWLG